MELNTSAPINSSPGDILEEESYPMQYEYASQGQRFVNWFIDNLLLRFGLTYITGTGVGILLAELAPEFTAKMFYSDETGIENWRLFTVSMLVGYVNYLLYYTLCEKLFRGYTLGKLITGTRAIRQDGTELSFKNALLRSLTRCVPFEVFSGFSTLTWHDSWTDTMVIKSR